MEIEIFGEEYNQIIKKKDKGVDVSIDILNYTKKILKRVLEEWKNKDNPWKEKISEDVGEIPIRLFSIEDVKIKKELDEIISQLMDIESSKAMKEIDRKSLIEKVYSELKNYSK